MKTLLTFCFILFTTAAWAQNEFLPIDRASIERSVTDSTKETFYPRLIERFNAFDTTLTKEDFRLIYFGFAFQKDYNGYEDQKESEINKAIKESKYLEAIKLCDKVLQKSPISLVANYKKGLALFKLNENDQSSIKYRNRYRNLRDAILESGNGLSCESGFKVLYVQNEYEIMYQYFEIEGFKTQSLEDLCDHFKINPSKYFTASDIYFDTSESLMSMEKLFKEK